MQSQFADTIRFVQKAVILHPDDLNKFLVLIRKHDDSSRPGDFDLPGGSVSKGELHEDALIREIKEESSLIVTDIKSVLVHSRINPDDGTYFLYIGYVATALNTDVSINPKEHDGYQWMTLDEFEALAPGHILLEQVKRGMTDQ